MAYDLNKPSARRVTVKENRYAVDLTHLTENGRLLLAFVLG